MSLKVIPLFLVFISSFFISNFAFSQNQSPQDEAFHTDMKAILKDMKSSLADWKKKDQVSSKDAEVIFKERTEKFAIALEELEKAYLSSKKNLKQEFGSLHLAYRNLTSPIRDLEFLAHHIPRHYYQASKIKMLSSITDAHSYLSNIFFSGLNKGKVGSALELDSKDLAILDGYISSITEAVEELFSNFEEVVSKTPITLRTTDSLASSLFPKIRSLERELEGLKELIPTNTSHFKGYTFMSKLKDVTEIYIPSTINTLLALNTSISDELSIKEDAKNVIENIHLLTQKLYEQVKSKELKYAIRKKLYSYGCNNRLL